jgi:glucosamine--fructose-6-phosphate aminotransferase (isomerizing)
MCGIVAGVGQKNVVPLLLEGLSRLEYRGYDSAGLAVLNPLLQRVRSIGRVEHLQHLVQEQQLQGFIGIAHTRWATHGEPSIRNAHPHVSVHGVAVIHNGIVENHESLKEALQSSGVVFNSDTDTEVIAHYLDLDLEQGKSFEQAFVQTVSRLEGTYALVVMSVAHPNELWATRMGSPLLLGISDQGSYLASDASALLSVTSDFIYLEEGDRVHLTASTYQIYSLQGEKVNRPIHRSLLTREAVELGPFTHFMQKEINEQPRALTDTINPVLDQGFVPELFGATASSLFPNVSRVLFLACGTSYHAAMVARYWMESIAGIPCTAEVASEYRYRISVPDPKTLVVTISQSGETADTLAALKHAHHLGQPWSLSISNVAESALTRTAMMSYLTRAGLEIGVASTKAFTTQLVALFSLTVTLAHCQGKITKAECSTHSEALRRLPHIVQMALNLEPQMQVWAKYFSERQHALFLGRGIHYPIALEGSLKLKEISYIHAEAYPAGELKHGPLALVDQAMPILAVAPNDELLEKLKSNLQEVRARGGELFVLADKDSHFTSSLGVHVVRLPNHEGYLSPIVHTIPLQLLAYHTACVRGADVDKPRNLAKSVTVE